MSIYLQIEGVPGDVKVKGYEGAIEIFNSNINRHIEYKQGVGSNYSKNIGPVIIGTLVLTKALDSSTNLLLSKFYNHDVISEAILSLCPDGQGEKCIMKDTYKNVVIVGYNEDESVSNVFECLTLGFSEYEKRYIPIDTDISPNTSGYNLKEGSGM